MRHDTRNTGVSDVQNRYAGDKPWSFKTGKGIFSTPVIGADGTVYVGSADTYFYALTAAAARCAGRRRPAGSSTPPARSRADTVTFGSGDEYLYRARASDGHVLWRFKATRPPATGQLVDWWEGNVAPGPDGDLYVGNTGGGAYRLSPDGKLRWVYQAGNSVWTTPAFGSDGSTYWGSRRPDDVLARQRRGEALEHRHAGLQRLVAGAVSRRPDALRGVVRPLPLRARPGHGRDQVALQDARPHLLVARARATDAVYVGSTDGSVYAVGLRRDREVGVRHRRPVLLRLAGAGRRRSSTSGSGNGKLYALDAATGKRRWAYDTTPSRPGAASTATT